MIKRKRGLFGDFLEFTSALGRPSSAGHRGRIADRHPTALQIAPLNATSPISQQAESSDIKLGDIDRSNVRHRGGRRHEAAIRATRLPG